MSSKSGSGSKRKAGGSEGGGGSSSKREGRREKGGGEKEKSRGGGGRDSRGEGSIDRPSVFSRLGTKMGGANRGSASNSSGAPAWSNRGSFCVRCILSRCEDSDGQHEVLGFSRNWIMYHQCSALVNLPSFISFA